MKSRAKIIIPLALVLAALMAVGGVALARKGPGGPGGHGGPKAELNLRMLERAAGQIGLEDATLSQIKDRVYESEKKGIDLKAKLELAKLELRRALDGDNPVKADVMKRVAEVGDLETRLRQHQIGLMLDVRALLTPEQRKQLKQIRSERRANRAKRGKRGKRGERGERGRRGGRGGPDGPPGAFD